jgi:hypothetical protein
VQYKGIFDMQDLYESIAEFFAEKKFKFYEKQQRYRKPGPFGPEILHQFEAVRDLDDYYQWTVNINIETFDMHEVEVVSRNGDKKKMMKGRLWAQLWGVAKMDPHGAWSKTAFMMHLKSFFNKYILRKKIEGVIWDELHYNIVLKLHALIKERLKMTTEVHEHRHFSRTH